MLMRLAVAASAAFGFAAEVAAACPAAKGGNFSPSKYLPDPFKFTDGSPVSSKADWECRRQEIRSLLQEYELGVMPPKPQSVTGKLNGNTLEVTVAANGKSTSFSARISYPAGGGAGPFPLLMGVGMLNIPVPAGVATLMIPADQIAQQNGAGSRNKGKFFDLYGATGAGSLIAWAWGAGRIIDALESLPEAKINTKRIGVNGCSRNGKGALVIGAFEERIALTIPQESGTGGSGCWRIADFENGPGQKTDQQGTQTAGQIVGENVWFSTDFTRNSKNTQALPYDHHMLLGLVAPRGLLTIDNAAPKWLGPMATWGCTNAARHIFEAIGAKGNMGESLAASHPHCSLPAVQRPEIQMFIDRFLLGKESTTDFFKSATDLKLDLKQWINWQPKTLA